MSKVEYKGVGRRKTSTARIILRKGTGQVFINEVEGSKYLKSEVLFKNILEPLVLTKTNQDYNVTVNVRGGGLTGQAGAIRLGVSKALLTLNPEFRSVLKPLKLLTRDPRIKERKKPGLRKARRARQFSKR